MAMNRRQFGRLAGGVAAASTLASVGALAQSAETLRFIWWGNPERDRRTKAVVELFEGETGIDVREETYAWPDYWQKLATMAAGGNLPDVLQMDYRYIFEYARRGQLADLDPFVGKELELADFDPNQLKSGRVDGKLYGVSLGANSMTYVYNKKMLAELGIELPDSRTWTSDEFMAMGKEAQKSLPDGVFWTMNMGWEEPVFQTWVRSRGKDLYDADGNMAFDEADLVDFFTYWKTMQDEGLAPPPDVQAQDTGKMEERMHVVGKAVFGFMHSNQLVATQNLMSDEAGIVMIPNAGDSPGHYLKPSMFLSMAEGSQEKSDAARLINFFVTNPAANDILLIERGVSGDASVRQQLLSQLTPTEKKIIEYLDIVATRVGDLPPPPPQNAGEIERAFRPAWEAVAFGQMDPATGAQDFHANAQRILKRGKR
ncbi:MAG: ABC transporter substrate-binding protein [Acuticoccus sp.]